MSEPQRDDQKHPLARMIGLGIVLSLIGIAVVLSIDWFPESASDAAGPIDTLYDVLLIVSVPVFVLVMTVAIYSVVRFRAKPGDMSDGAPIHGNTRLEIVWVSIPFILVTALAIYGWVVLSDIEAKAPNELEVHVVGQQYTWHFEYPDQKVKSDQLILPVDRPVHFTINSKDVLHSFWVPQFRLKSDAVPGLTTRLRLTPDKVGNYRVVCAELCGIGHSTMRNEVHVMPKARFTAWVAKQKGGGAGGGGGGGAAPDGKQVFTASGCGGCHTLAKAGTTGNVGPKLDDLAKAAGKLEPGKSAPAYVKESIETPNAFIVKGFPKGVMPQDYKTQLSPQQIDALVQYLLGVSGGKGK